MSNPIQEEIAVALLKTDSKKGKARTTLSRSRSDFPIMLVGLSIVGFGTFQGGSNTPLLPLSAWAVIGVALGIMNVLELSVTRRRLEAVITLLEAQKAFDQ